MGRMNHIGGTVGIPLMGPSPRTTTVHRASDFERFAPVPLKKAEINLEQKLAS